jgi:hypothetical protein
MASVDIGEPKSSDLWRNIIPYVADKKQQLDRRLEDFERQTSNQILAAIYQGLPADAAIEDFAQGVLHAQSSI